MTTPLAEDVARAYDGVADRYDEQLRRARWVRRALWARYDARFSPGARVLDLGCGTGIDTLHLASRGVHVTAIDASPAMIARLEAKLGDAGHPGRVDTRVGDAVEALSDLAPPFDGVVSSFAALNTVDLAGVAAETERLVRPGGSCIAHLLAPTYWRSVRARLLAPLSTARDETDHVVDLDGEELTHHVARRRAIYERHFRRGFLLRRRVWLDGLMTAVSAGRFFVLDLERRGLPGAPPA